MYICTANKYCHKEYTQKIEKNKKKGITKKNTLSINLVHIANKIPVCFV